MNTITNCNTDISEENINDEIINALILVNNDEDPYLNKNKDISVEFSHKLRL